jgi:DNA-binding response OmpR family regulator
MFPRGQICLTPRGGVTKMPQRAQPPFGDEESMAFVFVISREPRMRASVTEYLRERGYDTRTSANYDAAMTDLPEVSPNAIVVDVQGVPRGEDGSTFIQFNQWLSNAYTGEGTPAVVYLLHKGARRPHFRIDGAVIKKPFPIEALGEALRERLGHPRKEGHGPGIDLDLTSNTLRSADREAHLTNIEATLLAYLMEHEGEILHPRELLVDVWQYHDSAGASTLVRAHVSNLRRKLRDVIGTADQIQTIRGKGYRFSA